MYEYEYPHPAVATDAILFAVRDDSLQVLLIKRGGEPFKDYWAFPGGFVEIAEDLDTAAQRELAEETGLTGIDLEQFYTFGALDRDPRERVITVAYLNLVRSEELEPVAADDAAAVAWFSVDDLPPLAFDNDEMLYRARAYLIDKLETSDVALNAMADGFQLPDLLRVYEIILGETLDADVFASWVMGQDWLEES